MVSSSSRCLQLRLRAELTPSHGAPWSFTAEGCLVDDSLAAAAGYGSAAVSRFFLFSRNLLSDTFLARGMSVRNVHARDK